jgi:NAD(P)H-nitrite reductase large subunit
MEGGNNMGRPLQHVIIGASAAGLSAATMIKETTPDASVTLLSEEPVEPYFRPMIPYIISGRKTPEQIRLMDQGPYVRTGITIKTRSRVNTIDPMGRTVTLENGESHPYDRLLIATGSSPFLPPGIDGLTVEGVYPFRTLTQALHAAGRTQWAKHAVMLGGGLLNLKSAFALLEKGIAVTLVVYSPEILSQLMEPDDARMIRETLEKAGLKIMTGRSARAVATGKHGVRAVILENGDELPCDMVFVGKGVRPNTDCVTTPEIAVDQGVVVDEFTRTTAPDIFAAGDVAVTFDPVTGRSIVTGLWTNAVEMGRCAGRNMAGLASAYTGTFGVMNATQVANLPFVSMGIVHPGRDDYEVHTTESPDAYRKLVFSNDGSRLVGLVMIGCIEKAGLYRYERKV